jgi:hypothetical protein
LPPDNPVKRLPTGKVTIMSNAFVSTATTVALGATDIDSINTAQRFVSSLSTVRQGIEKRIENARSQVAETLILSVTGVMFVLDNGGESAKPKDLSEAMGISDSHASKIRTVGTLARFLAGTFGEIDKNGNPMSPACNLSYAKAKTGADNLLAWYELEMAGAPSAPSLSVLMADFGSFDGTTRLGAGQSIREIFGSIEKLYTIAKGTTVHPDAPEDEGDDEGDDEGAETWQGMLSRALEAARAQGATATEIMFIVRAFNNEV